MNRDGQDLRTGRKHKALKLEFKTLNFVSEFCFNPDNLCLSLFDYAPAKDLGFESVLFRCLDEIGFVGLARLTVV